MAISGCDLICENLDCKYWKKGLTFTSTWPLGDIDLVMETGKDKKEYYEGMLKLKEEGRKYACISMPNKADIPTLGYRVQKWCDNCKQLRLFDAIDEDINSLPSTCSTCNGELITFAKAQDITCPECKQKLNITRWFVNEKENDNG